MRNDDEIRADLRSYDYMDDERAAANLVEDVPALLARALAAEAKLAEVEAACVVLRRKAGMELQGWADGIEYAVLSIRRALGAVGEDGSDAQD